MKITQIEEIYIIGISTRTKNANEVNFATAKIAPLWQTFNEKAVIDYNSGVYGAYYNYESDAHGEFSVLAAAKKVTSKTLQLEAMTVGGGRYLVFDAKGEMPQVAIEVWGKVWSYFAAENAKHQRAYTNDFEYYKSQNEVEICISIKNE